MAKSTVCQSCHNSFIPEPRSRAKQKFCRKLVCQRVRRCRSQQQRRLDRSPPTLVAVGARPRSRLLKPSEVDWLANHPLFIGHLSQFTGSHYADDIREYMVHLIKRGIDILSTTNSGKHWIPLLGGHIHKPSKFPLPKR